MAYISFQPKDFFNTKLYAGNNTADTAISGVGFQPDLVWLKNRDNGTGAHALFDVVRGVSKRLKSDEKDPETTASGVSSFDSDGFTLGTSWNQAAKNFVSWNWKAGTTSGISAGSQTVTPSAYSINTTAGFGIYAYEGDNTPSGPKTISHGLGQKPSFMLVKRRNTDKDWAVYHSSIGATKYLELNNDNAAATSNAIWGDTEPTSSVFTVGPNSQTLGNPGDTSIAYVFCEKVGYSKFGKYVGNGNVDGVFNYTGFRPAWLLLKKTSNTESWIMHDNKRDPHNEVNRYLLADTDIAEVNSSVAVDFVSNGFKFRTSSQNVSGDTYVYMAFAEFPLVASNNIPGVAR